MLKEVKSDQLHQRPVVGQENDKKRFLHLENVKKISNIDIQDSMKELNCFKTFPSNWK